LPAPPPWLFDPADEPRASGGAGAQPLPPEAAAAALARHVDTLFA
jgi:hypothetical protein